jgi:F-type H+-transporting ATPase subunit epsilon
MNKTLHLTITTPAQILVASDDVIAVRVEDQSGSFGVLPGHADLLTALVPSVVRWRTVDGAACFCAVRGGVFAVSGGRDVSVACREGVVGDSLDELEAKVRTVRPDVEQHLRLNPCRSSKWFGSAWRGISIRMPVKAWRQSRERGRSTPRRAQSSLRRSATSPTSSRADLSKKRMSHER